MSKSVLKFSIYSLLIFIFSFSSCSKFEDGPLISLRTKKQRLARDWKIEYTINKESGIRHSADFEDWLLTFDKGGTFTKIVFYNNIETKINGTWELNENILRLEFSYETETILEFYTIMRLTKKELWMNDNLEEIYYYSE
ncbi:MAG: lipocalin family protein [Bacteroidales bacterium]|nr:lipocalin family protein [Bacteroidales bacterium]MBN2756105.1 lipocalin family protein [Bacteroidales bacterium]